MIYEVLENGYIKATLGDKILIIPNDPSNSDYQRYLNPVEDEDQVI
jgi:hypothetical protein